MTQANKPNIKFGCHCGKLAGDVEGLSRRTAVRVVCCCGSCQDFARHLGKAQTVLDSYGGTEVIMMSPRALRIDQGKNHLAALKMTKKGPVRFYASCCNTPLANIVGNPRVPFMSVIACSLGEHSSLNEALPVNTSFLDAYLGTPSAVINGNFAKSAAPLRSDWLSKNKATLNVMGKLAVWAVKGETKYSAFWDHDSGQLAAKPEFIV